MRAVAAVLSLLLVVAAAASVTVLGQGAAADFAEIDGNDNDILAKNELLNAYGNEVKEAYGYDSAPLFRDGCVMWDAR